MKNAILFGILILLVGGATFFSWDRYWNKNDYLVDLRIPCDPATESCFVFVDPECEGADCSYYYKIAIAPAFLLEDCRPDEGECLVEKCSESDLCEITLCSEETKAEFEILDDACSL